MKFPFFKKKSAIITQTSYPGATMFFFPLSTATSKTPREWIRAGYVENATVFACVKLITQSIAQLDSYLTRTKGDKSEEIYQHEILKLLDKPSSELSSRAAFFETLTSHLLLSGNVFIQKYRGSNHRPINLFFFQPYNIKVEDDGRKVSRYINLPDGLSYPPEDIIHIREFNPLNPWVGLSRVQAAISSIELENAMVQWNRSLVANDARPAGVLTTDQALTEAQMNRLKALFEGYQGYLNAGKVPVLPNGLDFKQLSLSPKDMDWLNAIKINSRRICSVFGVPAELLGDAEAKTYSNYQEARRAFWLETIIPLARNIYSALNAQLVAEWKEPGLELVFDIDQIEAIQENRQEKYAYLNDAWWLSLNEKRQAVGYDTVPGGDYIFVPSSIIPTLRTDKEVPLDVEDKSLVISQKGIIIPKVEKKLSRWRDREQRDRLWSAFEYLVKKKEKRFQQMVEKFLLAQADRAVRAIKQAGAIQVAKNVKILDIENEAKKYADLMRDTYLWHVSHGLRAGRRIAKGDIYELEEKFDIEQLTPEQRQYLESLVLDSGTKISKTTLTEVLSLLYLAEVENQTVEELAQAILEKFEIFAPWRARMIARTESAKSENWSELEGYKQDEYVELKGWLSARVPNSREAHVDASDYYEDHPIPIDEDFLIGDEWLSYPGDPKGSPGNVINCLCSLYPARRE